MQKISTLAIPLAAAAVFFAAGAQAQYQYKNQGENQAEKSGVEQLQLLNEGYSMLYGGVSGLSQADKIFLLKFENDATQEVVSGAAQYMAELTADLEQLAQDYPSLRLDLKPLPRMERKKQAAATEARIKSFAPIVGRTGPNFERTLLFTISGGLNQLRHLARVLADAERDEHRREFLESAEAGMDKHYNASQKLLSEQYYKQDVYEPPEE